jgi:hypothetical protein
MVTERPELYIESCVRHEGRGAPGCGLEDLQGEKGIDAFVMRGSVVGVRKSQKEICDVRETWWQALTIMVIT